MQLAKRVAGTTNRADYEFMRDEVLVQLTKVMGNRAVNEVKGGMSSYLLDQHAVATWSHHWLAPDIVAGGPRSVAGGEDTRH